MTMLPRKIGAGSHLRVIAPSRTLKIISEETRNIALKRFEDLGITVSYSKNAEESDEFLTSSIKSRVEDLHEAFADKTVDIILTAIGGFSVNEILDYLDYDLIAKNPKIICGFSDITALTNAIYAKTGLITYSGPHFSSFGMKLGFEYTLEYFKKCFLSVEEFEVKASNEWSDDAWFINQDDRTFYPNDGHVVINRGVQDVVEGRIIGGNLGLLNMLQGTEYFPELDGAILFLEHCSEDHIVVFNKMLRALTQSPSFAGVKAIVFGRFQKDNNMTMDILGKMVADKEKLHSLPIIAGVDFGHTTPTISFPVGGRGKLVWNGSSFDIVITEH